MIDSSTTTDNSILETEEHQKKLSELTPSGHIIAELLMEAAFNLEEAHPDLSSPLPLYVDQALAIQSSPELRETLQEVLGRLQ